MAAQSDALTTQTFTVRDSSQLPFFCKPVSLFLAVWLVMLAALKTQISYTSYPDLSVAVGLFALSLVSFLLGFATVRAAYASIRFNPLSAFHYKLNIKRLRRIQVSLLITALAVMYFNLKVHGLPPLFGFFGADTLDYMEYGSFKQVLSPALFIVFATAALEPSFWRKSIMFIAPPVCLLIYAARGPLLIVFFQALVIFCMRTSLSKRKLYAVAAAVLVIALLLSDFIGNGRSDAGISALLGYLQIKRQYYEWPGAYLWFVSYISTPMSNMCWITRVYPYTHPSLSFASSLLPGFLAGKPLEVADLGSAMIIDGVHTYLAKYYLDFWYFGVVGINYVWGVIAAYISAGNRLTRNYLSSAAVLSCLAFIFFTDFLTILYMTLDIVCIAVVQRCLTVQVDVGSSVSEPAT